MRDWYWSREWLPDLVEFLKMEPQERGDFVKDVVDTIQRYETLRTQLRRVKEEALADAVFVNTPYYTKS